MSASLIALTNEAVAMLKGLSVRLLCSRFVLPDELAGLRSGVDFGAAWQPVRARWSGRSKADLQADSTAAAYLTFYRALGINPSKSPPSALNLVNRFAIGANATRALPSINPAVDAGNLVQAQTLLPVAVFDADAVNGGMILDVSGHADTLEAFGYDGPQPVQADRLVLRDQSKVLSEFLYRDGKAQAVTGKTRRLLVIVCQVGGIADELADSAMMRVGALLKEALGAIPQ